MKSTTADTVQEQPGTASAKEAARKCLIAADALIKESRFDEARREIDKAKKLDSSNPYIYAFEDRIKHFQELKKSQSPLKPAAPPAPPKPSPQPQPSKETPPLTPPTALKAASVHGNQPRSPAKPVPPSKPRVDTKPSVSPLTPITPQVPDDYLEQMRKLEERRRQDLESRYFSREEEEKRKELEALTLLEAKRRRELDALAMAEELRMKELEQRATTEERRLRELEARAAAAERRRRDLEELAAAEEHRKREAEYRSAEEQRRRELEMRALAEEQRRRELEARIAAEEQRRKEAEAKAAAEEQKRKELEARAAAEEQRRKEMEARAAEEQRRRELEARAAAEELRRKELETRILAEEQKRKELEARFAAEEQKRKELERRAQMGATIGAEHHRPPHPSPPVTPPIVPVTKARGSEESLVELQDRKSEEQKKLEEMRRQIEELGQALEREKKAREEIKTQHLENAVKQLRAAYAKAWINGAPAEDQDQELRVLAHSLGIPEEVEQSVRREVKLDMYSRAVKEVIAKRKLLRSSSSTLEWLRKVYQVSVSEYLENESKFLLDLVADQYRGTILLVSGAESVKENLVPRLKSSGFAVVLSTTAENALEKIDKINPNLILCDTEFPEGSLSGIKFLHVIRNSSKFSFLPFILFCDPTEATQISSSELRPNEAIITKPINFDELTSSMNDKLARFREYISSLS